MDLLGGLAFLILFIGDWNDWKWGRRFLRICFPAGACLLAVTTVMQMWGRTVPAPGKIRIFFWILAAAFFLLMIDALFFALPRVASYARPGEERPAQTRGQYALCRHPGVLWFIGLYICLWLLGLPPWSAVLYCVLNILLAAFEDAWVFPAKLTGYKAYRKATPFLLPTPASIRACRGKD